MITARTTPPAASPASFRTTHETRRATSSEMLTHFGVETLRENAHPPQSTNVRSSVVPVRPAAYRRALDHDVRRRLTNFLKACRLPGLEALKIVVDCGLVTFRGYFESVEAHHLCIANARRLAGVIAINDESKIL